MDVQICDDCVLLGQKKYINELLVKVGLANTFPFPTPMSGNFLSKVNASQSSSSSVDLLCIGVI